MAFGRKIGVLLWLVFGIFSGSYSQVLENYGPIILESYPAAGGATYEQVEVKVDLLSFPRADFKLGLPAGGVVFWEDKLWIMPQSDTTIVIPVSSLVDFVGSEISTENRLTVIGTEIAPERLVIQKGFFENTASLAQVPTLKPRQENMPRPETREKSSFGDFFFTALISVLMLIAIYKLIYPFVFAMIITPTSVVSADDFSDSTGLQKFFSIDIIFFLLIINMAGFLLLMLFVDVTKRESLLFVVNGDTNQLFLYWLLGSLIMTGLGVLKFSFLRAFGFLFELNKIVAPHFFYLLRIISITIFVIAFIVSVILLNNFIDLGITVQYSLYAFFWIYLVGVFLLFWIMSSRVPFKNYHLFVYICTTELVPILIISKIVVG